jgi:glutamate synthase domain-containing protein 3
VVEGVGDHGCEYMTGGRVVVLGRTGRNFAAGMSGGVAFVFDPRGDFALRCNHELVELEAPGEDDERQLRQLLENHAALTGSSLAASLLAGWSRTIASFVKIMPRDYKRALIAREAEEAAAVAAVSRQQVAHG